jgi:hypothetical protein
MTTPRTSTCASSPWSWARPTTSAATTRGPTSTSAAGGGYHSLDTTEGQIDDELGYWAVAGLKLGNPKGASFYFEGMYRWMTATVTGVQAPGNPNVDDKAEFDLNGYAANAGIVWRW